MKLKEILSESTIKIPLANVEKEKIIVELVDLLYQGGKIEQREKILQAVLDREKVMSTGVGEGVAIPHGKAEGVKELVAAFGLTKKEVDFQAIDEKPVRLVFLLVGPPEATGPHLKALSRISRLLHRKEFREQLLHAKTAKEVLDVIQREEEKYFEL